jgi:hypothetical protein
MQNQSSPLPKIGVLNYFDGIPPRPSPHPLMPGPFPLYWRAEQSGRMK